MTQIIRHAPELKEKGKDTVEIMSVDLWYICGAPLHWPLRCTAEWNTMLLEGRVLTICIHSILQPWPRLSTKSNS